MYSARFVRPIEVCAELERVCELENTRIELLWTRFGTPNLRPWQVASVSLVSWVRSQCPPRRIDDVYPNLASAAFNRLQISTAARRLAVKDNMFACAKGVAK